MGARSIRNRAIRNSAISKSNANNDVLLSLFLKRTDLNNSTAKTFPVAIPHGFQYGDLWVHTAHIKMLTGKEEQLVVDNLNLPLCDITSLLLEQTVSFGIWDIDSNRLDAIRELLIGDRVALLLQLRKLTFGDKLQCDVTCASCGEKLSFDIYASMLLQKALETAKPEYHLRVEGFDLLVRPLRGVDLENLPFGGNKPTDSDPVQMMMKSCIMHSDPPLPDTPSERFIQSLSLEFEKIDPQAETVLSFDCLNCKNEFRVLFDIEKYFYQEVSARKTQLEHDIHWIALNYHWDEESILALSIPKRKRYVELINNALWEEGQ